MEKEIEIEIENKNMEGTTKKLKNQFLGFR